MYWNPLVSKCHSAWIWALCIYCDGSRGRGKSTQGFGSKWWEEYRALSPHDHHGFLFFWFLRIPFLYFFPGSHVSRDPRLPFRIYIYLRLFSTIFPPKENFHPSVSTRLPGVPGQHRKRERRGQDRHAADGVVVSCWIIMSVKDHEACRSHRGRLLGVSCCILMAVDVCRRRGCLTLAVGREGMEVKLGVGLCVNTSRRANLVS
jgi:hypothetical protein